MTDPDLQDLATQFQATVAGTRVDLVGDSTIRVMVPNARMAHDWVAVFAERGADDRWVLYDGGALSDLVGPDLSLLVDLLECAGAELEIEGTLVASLVEDSADVVPRALSFAHYMLAAPVVWHARNCMRATEAPSVPLSAVRVLARETKDQLVRRIGPGSDVAIKLNKPLSNRGERARIPLVVAAEHVRALPRLAAGFIDLEASNNAISMAKQSAAWMLTVTEDLRIPKFVVAKGADESALAHLAELYDRHNVQAVSADDLHGLENEVRDIVGSMGFAIRA